MFVVFCSVVVSPLEMEFINITGPAATQNRPTGLQCSLPYDSIVLSYCLLYFTLMLFAMFAVNFVIFWPPGYDPIKSESESEYLTCELEHRSLSLFILPPPNLITLQANNELLTTLKTFISPI